MHTVPQSSGERPWKPKGWEKRMKRLHPWAQRSGYNGSNYSISKPSEVLPWLHCTDEAVALERLL